MSFDFAADNVARQEAWRREQQQLLDLKSMAWLNQSQRQTTAHHGHGGLVLLLFVSLLVVGVVWLIWIAVRFVWRVMTGRTRSERELLHTIRRHGVSASDVRAGVEEVLRRQGK